MAPRLGGKGKRPTLHLATDSTRPPPSEGDNSRAIEEGERVQLISFVSRLSAADAAIELAKAPLKAAQKNRSQIVGLAKAAGFTAEELKRRLEEMSTPSREMAEKARREHKQRRWLGILDDDQASLMLGDTAPSEAKDEAHWKGEGYKAGLRQMNSAPPKECAERFVQPFMKEHERGLKEALNANAPKPMSPTPAEKAKADFAADHPEIDVDAAARKLKADKGFMDRTAPAEEEPHNEAAAAPNDGFEATPEELAGQAGRKTSDVV